MSEDENNNENDKMNAERMLDAIEESLREQGLKYFSERSARATCFGMTIPSIVQRVHVVYIADDSQYTLVAQVPEDSFCSDEARKPIVAKYICRVNRFVPLGFFNFDYDSGGIGFKLSVDCHGEKPTSERIMWSLMVAMELVCAYIPGIVVYCAQLCLHHRFCHFRQFHLAHASVLPAPAGEHNLRLRRIHHRRCQDRPYPGPGEGGQDADPEGSASQVHF